MSIKGTKTQCFITDIILYICIINKKWKSVQVQFCIDRHGLTHICSATYSYSRVRRNEATWYCSQVVGNNQRFIFCKWWSPKFWIKTPKLEKSVFYSIVLLLKMINCLSGNVSEQNLKSLKDDPRMGPFQQSEKCSESKFEYEYEREREALRNSGVNQMWRAFRF